MSDRESRRFCQARPRAAWAQLSVCVASIRRWSTRDGMGRALLGETMNLDAIDDNGFRMVLRQKLGFVLDALAKIDSPVPFMMPERLASPAL